MPIRCNVQYTSSARSLTSPRLIILWFKSCYTILITSRKLRHYFEYYKIAMVTEFPLGDILHNKEANGRIIKWAIELGTYSIEFRSRPTIKSQALADFVAEGLRSKSPSPPPTLSTE